jgi:transcriptional regulator with XRE-family HTH domain
MPECNKKADTIGKRITALRKERNLTQEQLANALHMQRVTLNYWENDTRAVSTPDIIRLADYFGTTCDYIMRGVEPENVDAHRTLGLSNGAIRALKRFQSNCDFGKDGSYSAFGERIIRNKQALSVLDCISAVLEEPNHSDRLNALLCLHAYFTTDIDKNTLYTIDPSLMPVRGSDIYAARLLDIQVALIRLKESIDATKIK